MDIVSYSKAAKVEREVKQARDSYASLDGRLDAVSVGNVVSVRLKTELPTVGEAGRLYLVRQDSSNQNESTTYTYSGGKYVKVGGDRVSNHPENGTINLNGTKTVIYSHPDTHSADMLTDGSHNVIMTLNEREKLSNIELEANYYTHPDTHSADMISDGETHVSMTWGERKRLNVIDPWESISDLVDYTDVVTYFAFDIREELFDKSLQTTTLSSLLENLYLPCRLLQKVMHRMIPSWSFRLVRYIDMMVWTSCSFLLWLMSSISMMMREDWWPSPSPGWEQHLFKLTSNIYMTHTAIV